MNDIMEPSPSSLGHNHHGSMYYFGLIGCVRLSNNERRDCGSLDVPLTEQACGRVRRELGSTLQTIRHLQGRSGVNFRERGQSRATVGAVLVVWCLGTGGLAVHTAGDKHTVIQLVHTVS